MEGMESGLEKAAATPGLLPSILETRTNRGLISSIGFGYAGLEHGR